MSGHRDLLYAALAESGLLTSEDADDISFDFDLPSPHASLSSPNLQMQSSAPYNHFQPQYAGNHPSPQHMYTPSTSQLITQPPAISQSQSNARRNQVIRLGDYNIQGQLLRLNRPNSVQPLSATSPQGNVAVRAKNPVIVNTVTTENQSGASSFSGNRFVLNAGSLAHAVNPSTCSGSGAPQQQWVLSASQHPKQASRVPQTKAKVMTAAKPQICSSNVWAITSALTNTSASNSIRPTNSTNQQTIRIVQFPTTQNEMRLATPPVLQQQAGPRIVKIIRATSNPSNPHQMMVGGRLAHVIPPPRMPTPSQPGVPARARFHLEAGFLPSPIPTATPVVAALSTSSNALGQSSNQKVVLVRTTSSGSSVSTAAVANMNHSRSVPHTEKTVIPPKRANTAAVTTVAQVTSTPLASSANTTPQIRILHGNPGTPTAIMKPRASLPTAPGANSTAPAQNARIISSRVIGVPTTASQSQLVGTMVTQAVGTNTSQSQPVRFISIQPQPAASSCTPTQVVGAVSMQQVRSSLSQSQLPGTASTQLRSVSVAQPLAVAPSSRVGEDQSMLWTLADVALSRSHESIPVTAAVTNQSSLNQSLTSGYQSRLDVKTDSASSLPVTLSGKKEEVPDKSKPMDTSSSTTVPQAEGGAVKQEEPEIATFSLDEAFADDPFFQALSELKQTNEKAKEIEEKIKQERLRETQEVRGSHSLPTPGQPVSTLPPAVDTPTPASLPESMDLSSILSEAIKSAGIDASVMDSPDRSVFQVPSRPYSPPSVVGTPFSLDMAGGGGAGGGGAGRSVVRMVPRTTVGQMTTSLLQHSSLHQHLTDGGYTPTPGLQRVHTPTPGLQRVHTPTTGLQRVHTPAPGLHRIQSAPSPGLQRVQSAPTHMIQVVDGSTHFISFTSPQQMNGSLVRTSTQMHPSLSSATNPFLQRQTSDFLDTQEEEEEELGHAETYNDYMPSKSKIGLRHPDPVVETSSMASVEPADIDYELSLPSEVIDCGHLSALQLESIVYSCQKHQDFLPNGERAGFLIGDGAGVGKGRTLAGIIYENYLCGRKRSLWLSVSNDLRLDSERDLRDILANRIEVHPLNKFKYAKISSKVNGKVKKGVIFSTYSALIGESSAHGKYRTRFKQLIHWLGKDFDGVIVFDECHRAKNLCPVGSSKPTKTGLTVLELQKSLPKARIVYASATGASEPRNMAYMTRLGLWGPGTPFADFMEFINAVERRGVGAMELVAMDMKLRGMYIARQLSFQGVTFQVENVPIPADYHHIYNRSVKLWVQARNMFQEAAELMGEEQRNNKTMWGQFWSAHQRFFKYLCISAKVDHCVKIAKQALKHGKCVVIGLQSTGEARTQEQLDDYGEINDFISTAKGVFQSLVERHFPAPNRPKTLDLGSVFGSSSENRGIKRKKDASMFEVKRRKEDWSDDSDTSNSKSTTSSRKNKKKAGASDGRSPSMSSDNDQEEEKLSSSSSSSEEDEDFNPFAGGSDDDDLWGKRFSQKEKRKKARKAKKEKQKKKKKSKKKDDDDDEYDKLFDEALERCKHKAASSSALLGDGDCGAVDRAAKLKQDLLLEIERLGDHLPPNTLDQLIDELGGPSEVAEMTGRKGRIVSSDSGTITYESRSETDVPLELLNLAEKGRFMAGEKFVAIISEAASSGISLQADRRAMNQRRRVHITLELPWSADRAIQQFGRSHRSNQVSAPEYVFLISELAGERRFASTVAKRLESLGALTHGDRRATETRDLSRFNIDNKYGRSALETMMRSIVDQERPLVPPPTKYSGNFFADARQGLAGVGLISWNSDIHFGMLEKDYNNMNKFLNRLLGIEIELQNCLFQYFQDTLAHICVQAKRNGRWDLGILDLGSSGESVTSVECQVFVGSFSGMKTKVELHTVRVERGCSWEEALRRWYDLNGEDEGFYVSTPALGEALPGRRSVMLVELAQGKKQQERGMCDVIKPNTGLQSRRENIKEIKAKNKKVLPDEAQKAWLQMYECSSTMCSHLYWRGACRRSVGLCEVGLRTRTYHVLSGSVLSVWTTVEQVLSSSPTGYGTRMQIIRLKTDDGKRIVGTLIPFNCTANLIAILTQEAQSTYNVPNPASEARNASQQLSSTRPAYSSSLLASSSGAVIGRQPATTTNPPPQPSLLAKTTPKIQVNVVAKSSQVVSKVVKEEPDLYLDMPSFY